MLRKRVRRKIFGLTRMRKTARRNRNRGRRTEAAIAKYMDFTKHGLYGNEDAFDNVLVRR